MRARESDVARLATILNKLDHASQDPARIDALLAAFVDGAAGPFAGAGLFRATREGAPFVLTASRGCASDTVRAWRRWPLGRLFTRMKPARILDPDSAGAFALAVPLRYGAQRYVVIAPLNLRGVSAQYEPFFEALESVTVPHADTTVSLPDEIPLIHAEPRIVGLLLCQDLDERLSAMLSRRGWTLLRANGFRAFREILADEDPDLIVVDTAEMADPISALRAVQHAVGSRAVYVMAVESRPRLASQAPIAADRFICHDDGEAQLFATFKEIFRGIDLRRRERAQRSTAVAAERIAELSRPQELAEFAAYHAADLMRGWAGIALVSGSGTVYRAEHPQGESTILSKIPSSFLSDTPLFSPRVDQRFLDEVCDDEVQRQALQALKPVSAASVPIRWRDERLGALVAVSKNGPAESSAFEALCRLARDIARRFFDMNSGATVIPEFRREGLWERWSDRMLEVAVYRSRDCALPWRYRSVADDRGVLTLGIHAKDELYGRLAQITLPNQGEIEQELRSCVTESNQFAALVDTELQSMVFAARDFSPPLLLESGGPSASIARSEHVTTGVAMLAGGETLICDRRLWKWFGDHSVALRELPGLLDERKPPGLASVVRMSS